MTPGIAAAPRTVAAGAALQPRRQRVRQALPALWLLLPLWIAAVTVRELVAAHNAVQFNDQWSHVTLWRLILQGEPWVHYLLGLHNEHRIVLPRLVALADYAWFDGRNIATSLAMLLLQLTGAACFVRLARQLQAGWPRALGLAAALAFVFTLAQWENLFWGFQVCFVGVHALAVWALYCFVSATGGPVLRWRRLGLALLLLAASTFMLANGLFAGVAMAAIALAGRRGWRAVALPVAATALLLALQLIGYQRPPHDPAPPLDAHRLLGMLAYASAYLGNVFVPPSLGTAQAAGALGLAGALAMAWRLGRTRAPSALSLVMFGIVVLVLITALATAMSRAHFGTGQALSSRYATPTAYFWAAQLMFWADQAGGAPRRVRQGLALLLAGICVLMLLVETRASQALAGTRERLLLGASAQVGGTDDAPALQGIFPELEVVKALTGFLRAQRLSVFARPPPAQVGQPLRQVVVETHPDGCRGAFDRLLPVAGQAGTLRAAGWAWDADVQQPPRWIALTDVRQQVLGLAPSGVRRLDVPAALREVRHRDTGWIGSLRRPVAGPVIAYALLAEGWACRLGELPVPP